MTEAQAAELTLQEITRREVSLYAADSDMAKFYPMLDEQNQTYAVIIVPNNRQERPPQVFVMARMVGDYIVIEEDTDDKPLVEALMVNGGVPREKIILAHQGETIPESAGKGG